MANSYKVVRFEPHLNADGDHAGKCCSVTIGLNAESSEKDAQGNPYTGYIDGVWNFPEGTCPTESELQSQKSELSSKMIANYGWIKNLDAQIESKKKSPIMSTEDYDVSNITIDTTVAPEPGSPAAPVVEEEESSEEEGG